MRRGGSPRRDGDESRPRRAGDESAFRAWWSAAPVDAQAAEARAAALAAFRKRKCAKLGDACCSACAALDGAQQHEALVADAAANAQTPDALFRWRDSLRSETAASAPADAGICGMADGHALDKRSRAGKERACGLWSLELSSATLAAHAGVNAGSEPLLEWPSVEEFTDALDRYLKDRLLCKVRRAAALTPGWEALTANLRFVQDCRVNVLRSLRELCAASASAPCGCSADFCTSLVETGSAVHAGCAYTLTAQRLAGDWAPAFAAAPADARFEWSVGTDAGADDEVAWSETPEGGPRLDVPLALDAAAAHYINLRVVGAADALSSRAQPMFGEQCAHTRLTLTSDGRVALSAPAGLHAFFENAAALQAEDAAEAVAAAGDEAAAAWSEGDAAAAPGGEDDDAAHDSHVDTPELAAEALLDAACVLAKERVERSARRAAAAAHVRALAAAAAAAGVEAALRAAFDDIAAAARQEALLAEIEAEAAAAAAKAEARARKKGNKKAKGAQASPPPPASEQPATPAESPPSPPTPEAAAEAADSPVPEQQLASALAALAPFPPSPAAAEDAAEMVVGTPPRSPVGAAWQQAAAAPAAASPPADDGAWSAVQGRRRRRLSSANGSSSSLQAEGEGMDAAEHFPALRVPPPRAMPQRASAARQPPSPPAAVPAAPAFAPQAAMPPPVAMAMPQRLPLYAAPPLLATQAPPPPYPYAPFLPPFAVRAFPTAAYAAPPQWQQAAPATPPVSSPSPQSTPTAAFYDAGNFGLFQLPIGGGAGGFSSMFK